MTRPLRLGLIGLGVVARYYLAAARRLPGVEFVAVCDRDAAALAAHPDRADRYLDHRELLAAGAVDGVVITVPNDVHARVCDDALRAGRAVCVEKPLATRLPDGVAVVRAAARRGLPLLTAFHRRHNDNVLALAEGLRGGPPVGRMTVRYLEDIDEQAGRDRWYLDPRRCGGGCVADNGPNAFDLVRLFLGEVEVTAATLHHDSRGVDVRAAVDLRARTGGIARVELDWGYRGERKDVVVELAGGEARAADMLAGYPGFKASLWHEYEGVLRDFAHAIEAPAPGLSEAWRPDPGLAALTLVDAVYTMGGRRAGRRRGGRGGR